MLLCRVLKNRKLYGPLTWSICPPFSIAFPVFLFPFTSIIIVAKWVFFPTNKVNISNIHIYVSDQTTYFQAFVLLHRQLAPLRCTFGRYILYLLQQFSHQEEMDFWDGNRSKFCINLPETATCKTKTTLTDFSVFFFSTSVLTYFQVYHWKSWQTQEKSHAFD